MPVLVQVPSEQVYGKPNFPIVPPPIHDMKTPVRVMLSDTMQQYDPRLPVGLQRDEYLDDLFGVRADGPGFSEDFTDEQQGIAQWGMRGMGALAKRAMTTKLRAQMAPMATATPPAPVMDSTKYLVIGGAALAIAASVGLWSYFKHRKKGR